MFKSLKYGSLIQRRKCMKLKVTGELYTMIMKNDRKFEKKIDLSIQNWYGEFDEFLPEHSKISKICTLIGCFWPKCIMFEQRSREDLCLIVLNIDVKFEEKQTFAFRNDKRNLANFPLQAEIQRFQFRK